MPDDLKVGKRLATLLTTYDDLTQADLAEMLGVDTSRVSRYIHQNDRANRTLVLLLDRIEKELHDKHQQIQNVRTRKKTAKGGN